MADRMSSKSNLIVGVVVAIVAVAFLFAAFVEGDDPVDPATAFGRPVVEGAPLSPLSPDGPDPTVGQPAPVTTGSGLDGATVTVGDGSQVVAFLAHWCPHCRAEVPVVVDWVAEGRLPEGVGLVAVATATDEGQANFPPTTWLTSEDWPAPVLLDDADDTAGSAYGVSGFPFWVAIAEDGTVAARASGELTPQELDELAATVAPDGA